MPDVNYLAIVVSAVACVVLAAVYYGVLSRQYAAVSPAAAEQEGMPAWLLPVELLRALVLAAVVAGVSAEIGITELWPSVWLALALWVGFPVLLLSGSVLHEKVPVKLAVLHAGDWLLKLLLIAVLVGLWR